MKLNPFHPLSRGLQTAYLFNECGGNTLYDSVGTKTGTLTSGPAWTEELGISGLKFVAGSSQYVTIDETIDTSGEISVAFGNYVSTAASNYPVTFGGYGTHVTNDRFLAHAPSTDDILYWDYGDSGGTGRVSIDYTSYLGKLTNIVLVSEGIGGSFKGIYLNGVLANSVASSDGPSGTITIELGRFNGSNYNSGILTYLYIYNRRLSAEEAMWLDLDPYGMFVPDFTPIGILLGGVDSENKRRSVMSTYWHPMYQTSDGSISAQDRMQIAGLYSGILSGSPGAAQTTIFGLENGKNNFIFGGQVIR